MRYLPRLISFLAAFIWITCSFIGGAQVSAASPLSLPAGFLDEAAYSGLLAPRAFTFTPDGRVLATERGNANSNDSNFASIRVFKNGTLLPTRAYSLDTCGDSERGLLGIAVDPNFASNHYIYVYYTRQATSGPACGYNTFTNGDANGPRNRISRLTMDYPSNPDLVKSGSEVVLIDSIITEIGYHNAGDLRFGTDGYLYASTGEGGVPESSPDTSMLNGKILRILPSTLANPDPANTYTTAGNPYNTAPNAHTCSKPIDVGLTGPCKEIFAKGFRNPFRFTIQPNMPGIPGTGSPVVGDVGGGVWEEINQVHSGGDYGHPVREGYCPAGILCSPPYQNGGYDNPVYAYPHIVLNANFDSAVIGGDFYIGNANFPAQYNNNYFFADFARGFIARLIYNSSTGQWTRPAQDFASGGNGIIGLKRGPDNNLYYLTFTSETDRVDGIRRIRYSGAANQPPTAQASVSPQSGPIGQTYTFDATGSVDPDNNAPLTYNWDFGDGVTESTSNLTITHDYDPSITTNRIASLIVKDSGLPPATSAPVQVTVYPGNTPASGDIVLTNLTDGSRTTTFYAGDTWAYSAANVTDDDMANPPTVTWQIVFHHETHSHPFWPTGTPDQKFTIPNSGELDPVIWYRVHLFITDSRGQRTEVIQDIQPVTSALTFNTNPTSGRVIIEGATFPTPLTITRVVGMRFSVNAPSSQSIWNIPHVFDKWVQGGNQLQTITVPDTDTAYTANFKASPGVATSRNYFTTSTPTLTWNRVTGAIRYVVQIGNDQNFTNPTDYEAGNNLAYTLPTLTNGFYYWHVAGCATATTCGNYSATDAFVVDAP